MDQTGVMDLTLVTGCCREEGGGRAGTREPKAGQEGRRARRPEVERSPSAVAVSSQSPRRGRERRAESGLRLRPGLGLEAAGLSSRRGGLLG